MISCKRKTTKLNVKSTVFYFLLFQVSAWILFFGNDLDDSNPGEDLTGKSWQVVNPIPGPYLFANHESIDKLTFYEDGRFVRLTNEGKVESGHWEMHKSQSNLSLITDLKVENYKYSSMSNENNEALLVLEQIDAGKSIFRQLALQIGRFN